MAILEDEYQRAERGADREQVHHDGFDWQHDRAEEHEQHDDRREHHEQDRTGRLPDDEVDRVEVDRREAGDQQLTAGRRRQRADLADELARLVAVQRDGSLDVEEHDVFADGLAQERLQRRG